MEKNKIKTSNALAVLSIIVMSVLIIYSLFVEKIFPIDLSDTDLKNRLIYPSFIDSESTYILGTDQLGRDVFIRLSYGIRNSIRISFTGMIVSLIIGVILGAFAGFFGGKVDDVISFITDSALSIPTIFVGIIFAVILGQGATTMIIVIAASGWAGFTRLVRGQVMQIKNSSYIEVSKSMGASSVRIIFKHILPNIVSPIIVHAAGKLSSFIILESTLSFLGLGIQPPDTSLGVMVSEGRDYLLTHWWLSIVPSIVIVIISLSVATFGDWLRDYLDPKSKQI